MRGELDPVAARELADYATNHGDLYRQRITPIIANLQRKLKRGAYDAEKAVKLWRYAADDAAKRYAAEFGTQREWAQMFTVPTREAAAKILADYYSEELLEEMRENPDENERRIATERKIVRRLIREAINAGWHPVYVYDGEQQVRVKSEKAALDVVFSVDESTITFQNAEGKRAGALIVLGNYYDVFVDYNPTPGFNEAMERVEDYVNDLQEREA